MKIVAKHTVIILLCFLALDSFSQARFEANTVRPQSNTNSISTAALIPLDSLFPPRAQRKLTSIRICGSCSHNGPMAVFLFTIRKKTVPMSMDIASYFPVSSLETIVVLKAKKAKKYGKEAEMKGVVIFTLKKTFEKQVLASLPQDFKALHKL